MRSFVLALGTVALLSTASCISVAPYKGPLEQLAKGSADTRVGIQTLSEEINALGIRNRAIAAAATSARFGDKEMAPVISPNFMAARMAGLVMIERYTAQLLQVVKSDEGATAAAGLKALATDVDAFSKKLAPTEAKAYAAPLSGLAQVILGFYDQDKRGSILKAAVVAGVPAAKVVLGVLEADFMPGAPLNFDALKIQELKMRKVENIAAYDQILLGEQGLTPAQRNEGSRFQARLAALEAVIETQRLIDNASSDQVYQTLVALDKSLDALKAASEQAKPSDETLTALAEQLATFSGNAVSLLEAVNAVKSVSSAK